MLAHGAEGGLEAVDVLHRSLRGLGIGLELGKRGGEGGLVRPDLRRRGGFAAGLGIVGEQRRHLGRGIGIDHEHLDRLGIVVGRRALREACARLGRAADALHDRLALGDGGGLREDGGRTKGDGKRDADGSENHGNHPCFWKVGSKPVAGTRRTPGRRLLFLKSDATQHIRANHEHVILNPDFRRRAASIARQTRSGVAGMSICAIP